MKNERCKFSNHQSGIRSVMLQHLPSHQSGYGACMSPLFYAQLDVRHSFSDILPQFQWSCEWSTWSIQVANFWQPIRNTYCYGRGIICGYGADITCVYVYVLTWRAHHWRFGWGKLPPPSPPPSLSIGRSSGHLQHHQQHHQQLIVWESLSLGISTHYDAIGTFNAPPPHAPQPPGTHLPLSHVPQILSTRN